MVLSADIIYMSIAFVKQSQHIIAGESRGLYMAEVSIFSFFAGCGILDLAFERSGYDIVFVNEFSEEFINGYQFARKKLNLSEPIYGYRNDTAEKFSYRKDKQHLLELMEMERRKGKLVGFIGGPPCPDFSVGGKNAGENGENGRLTRVYFDLICRCKPDFFVFENVKGLIKTEKHRSFYNEMKLKAKEYRYIIADNLLNAIEYGVPQYRERIIMVGIRDDLVTGLSVLITPQNQLEFNWNQNKLYQIEYIKDVEWPTMDQFVENGELERKDNIPLELTVEYWFERNHVFNHPNGQDVFCVRKGFDKINTIREGDTRGKSFKRLHRWRYSPTAAYGHNEVHLHPYRARRISVAEAMAIQSLPEEFALPAEISLSSKFKMIGNGVPYLMAQAIAQTLMGILNKIAEERSIGCGDRY